ncbi:hypothetical protein AAGG74_14835 [Bacillus mexicanus]|uniref:hypothetical protein n=1 Tax=Bacillus mexicanus TaxID=2834415 RepID=UPI003D1FA27D
MIVQTFTINWDNEEVEYEEVLSLPVYELPNETYLHIIRAKWFSDEFYSLIKNHSFSIVVKNTDTGETTAIRTFGTRFPLLLTQNVA